MRAFILAGGFATRLWPLTEKRAKPLLPLAGKPLLTHLVEKIPHGIPITVSTNAVFAEDFEQWKTEFDRDIQILIEDAGHEGEKLGALGAVAKWITEERIEEDVLLLAGDNYMGFAISSFIEHFSGKPLLAAFDIADLERAKQFGIVVTESSPATAGGALNVTGFQEKPAEPQSTLVSTGCYVLPQESLGELVSYAKEHPDNIGGVFEHYLSQGIAVQCASFAEPWFDIGSFHAYIQATTDLVGENVLGADGASHTDSEMQGSVVLGENSNVRKSRLKNVVLFADCDIEDCVLEDCVVDNSCTLRGVDLSGKMLREGTVLTR